MGYPKMDSFMMEAPTKMDDLGLPDFRKPSLLIVLQQSEEDRQLSRHEEQFSRYIHSYRGGIEIYIYILYILKH